MDLDYATCPRCGKTARGKREVDHIFGLRNMGNGTIRVQSWCKDCRSKYS